MEPINAVLYVRYRASENLSNRVFALPLVQSDLNSSFALPPIHSALLPVNDIFLKQSPVHHSVTLGHPFTAPNHPPRTPIDQSTERKLSLVAEVNLLHAQLRRQAQQSQQPPPGVPAAADRLIQTAASVSEGERDQAPTAAETETTNREHAVVTHAAPTPTNATSVAERTPTPATSSTSNSPCDHARSSITSR